MNKQIQTIAVILSLLSTGLMIYMNASSYARFFSNFSDYFSLRNMIGLLPQLLMMMLVLFELVLGVMALATTGPRQDWAYKILRYLTVMIFIMYLPITFFVFMANSSAFAMASTSTMIMLYASRILTLAAVVLFLMARPQSQPPAIDLAEYELVSYTSTGHRFVHYLVDTIFVLPVFLTTYALIVQFYSEHFLLMQLVFLLCYFMYSFLSEWIFGQTLGKMMTRSCVAGIGYKPTAGRILIRSFGRWIPFDPLSFLMGRNWHDTTTSTTVVYVDSWEKAFNEADHDREDWLTA
ncbi:RDD family protein [Paraflavitalea pollutisoli]|uniref:RDD family protein n=1 Tax=Paraflavitalea pollutisoli TaxID=3034143 RepID=UPI0023ECEBA1|nr:RDD family protein [Paraflavitalea sp. H1-2-19X]